MKQRHHTAKTHVAAAQAAWGAMKAARALDEFDEDLKEGSVSINGTNQTKLSLLFMTRFSVNSDTCF